LSDTLHNDFVLSKLGSGQAILSASSTRLPLNARHELCERGSACRRQLLRQRHIKIEDATCRKPMYVTGGSRETACRPAWYIEQHDPGQRADEMEEKGDQCPGEFELLSGGWAGRCMRGERLPYWPRAAAIPGRAGPALPRLFSLHYHYFMIHQNLIARQPLDPCPSRPSPRPIASCIAPASRL
jgi:hypothetical protein